jgi:hypothetical protein
MTPARGYVFDSELYHEKYYLAYIVRIEADTLIVNKMWLSGE